MRAINAWRWIQTKLKPEYEWNFQWNYMTDEHVWLEARCVPNEENEQQNVFGAGRKGGGRGVCRQAASDESMYLWWNSWNVNELPVIKWQAIVVVATAAVAVIIIVIVDCDARQGPQHTTKWRDVAFLSSFCISNRQTVINSDCIICRVHRNRPERFTEFRSRELVRGITKNKFWALLVSLSRWACGHVKDIYEANGRQCLCDFFPHAWELAWLKAWATLGAAKMKSRKQRK